MREELEGVTVFPVGVGQREEIAALGGAGVVDEDVEAAELALRPPRPGFVARPDRVDRSR